MAARGFLISWRFQLTWGWWAACPTHHPVHASGHPCGAPGVLGVMAEGWQKCHSSGLRQLCSAALAARGCFILLPGDRANAGVRWQQRSGCVGRQEEQGLRDPPEGGSCLRAVGRTVRGRVKVPEHPTLHTPSKPVFPFYVRCSKHVCNNPPVMHLWQKWFWVQRSVLGQVTCLWQTRARRV